MMMKKVIALITVILASLAFLLIYSQQKNLKKEVVVVLSESQQRLAEDVKNFRTSARTPSEHYQEHLRDIVHCQEFVAWLGANRKVFEALDDFFNSGSRSGINFFYDKPFSKHASIQNLINARGRVDVYSDFHDGTSDANYEQMHCNTKKQARLALIDDFGLSYEAWQIRKSIFERDCKDIADAGDNPYDAPTIETLRSQSDLIRKRYSEIFSEEIRKSMNQCQQSIRARWIDTKKQYDDSKLMRANALKWIDELERAKP